MNREDTFKSVYGVEAPKAVLGLYIEDLQQVKRLSKTKQYQGLLELLLRYSYAIFYDYKTVSIINNRLKYRQEAMKILNNDDVEKAFNFIARATEPKETAAEKLKRLKEELKELKGTEYEAKEKEIKKLEESLEGKTNTCIAKDEINRLKEELDTKSYKLAKGQKEEDKQIFIKVALVALSTGARLKEITETLELSSRKGVTYFIDGEDEKEGIILEIDIKTIRAYLKDIRSHFDKKATETIESYKERFEKIAKDRKSYDTKDYEKYKRLSAFTPADIDISTGVRKAIKRLEILGCGNTNDLNTLYKSCLTSSTPK